MMMCSTIASPSSVASMTQPVVMATAPCCASHTNQNQVPMATPIESTNHSDMPVVVRK